MIYIESLRVAPPALNVKILHIPSFKHRIEIKSSIIAPFSRADSAVFVTKSTITTDQWNLIELTDLNTSPAVSMASNLDIDAVLGRSKISLISKEPVLSTSTVEMFYMISWAANEDEAIKDKDLVVTACQNTYPGQANDS